MKQTKSQKPKAKGIRSKVNFEVDLAPLIFRFWLLAFGFVRATPGQAAPPQHNGPSPDASPPSSSDEANPHDAAAIGPLSLSARLAVERWDDPRFERLTGANGGARFALGAAYHRSAWSLGLFYEPVVEWKRPLRPALSATSRHAAAQLSGAWRRALDSGWSLAGGVGLGVESLTVALASRGDAMTTEDRAVSYGIFASGGREVAPGFAVELRAERRFVAFELGEALGPVRGNRWQIGMALIYRSRGRAEES